MRLLFISNYFPPEVNAPATRLVEHARQWAADGHEVDVMTSVPNFPEGRVYEGYSNRYQEERLDGIDVRRVPMYVAENKGTFKRTLSYVSFMFSCILYSRRVRRRPDVVVATSPQFFAAIGGYLVARLKRAPFVLEIRDLWPESVVAVGAAQRSLMIRLFERIERFLYRKSDHIVVVTDAFKRNIIGKGTDPEKISVLKNGFDLDALQKDLDPALLEELRREYDVSGKFVASYIGTIGMAHGVEVLLQAAARSTDPDVVFMIVGTGAERARIEKLQEELQLSNVRLVDKQPRDRVPYLLELTDVSVVHLRNTPVFRTVIPSKIFEAMAMKRPIVLGVRGESEDIIRDADAGLPVEPENAEELLAAIDRLKKNGELYGQMSSAGLQYVRTHHDRRVLARRYWAILEDVVRSPNSTVASNTSEPREHDIPKGRSLSLNRHRAPAPDRSYDVLPNN